MATTEEKKKRYVYRNTTDQKMIIPGVGEVKAHGLVESDTPIENPNLVVEKDERMTGVDPAAEAPRVRSRTNK